jgi:hypothetical protein
LKFVSDEKRRSKMDWEYEIVGLKGKKDIDMLPLLEKKGNLSWELVSVVASIDPDRDGYEYLAFLKRPAEDD